MDVKRIPHVNVLVYASNTLVTNQNDDIENS